MPYGQYTKKIQVTVAAGATDSIASPMTGRIPDEVMVKTESGDAKLQLSNWDPANNTFDAHNPGAMSNTSTLILVYRHSIPK